MHWDSAHGPNIADVGGDGFVANRVGKMQISDEVRIFGEKVGTEDSGIAGRKIEDCGVVTDTDMYLASPHPARRQCAALFRGESA